MNICIGFLLSLGNPGGAPLLPRETVCLRRAALRPGSGCGMDCVRTASEDVFRAKMSATSFRGFVPRTNSALEALNMRAVAGSHE